MNILNVTVSNVIKRPFIIIVPGILMLVLSLLNSLNPIIPIIVGLVNTTGGTFFENVIAFLQLFLNPGWIPAIISIFVGLALLISLLSGVILSGYFYIVNKTLDQKEKSDGEFVIGIKKYFTKFFLITLRTVLIFILLTAFILVACVPALVVTGAAMTNKPELLIAAIFIDSLTVITLFFALMFSRAYLFYWYPSAIVNSAKPFAKSKKFADRNFWKITFRFIIFDLVFIAFQYLFSSISVVSLKFLLGWIFSTLFFLTFAIFIFYTYKEYSC